MFSYKHSTYQIFMDTCNENNIKRMYQLMGDKKHDTNLFHQKKYSSIFDYLIEYM